MWIKPKKKRRRCLTEKWRSAMLLSTQVLVIPSFNVVMYSNKISEIFAQNNHQAQNYESSAVPEHEFKFEVRRRLGQAKESRMVELVDGIWCCSCREGENMGGGSCRHIQCVNGGAFDERILFLDRWEAEETVDIIPAKNSIMSGTASEHAVLTEFESDDCVFSGDFDGDNGAFFEDLKNAYGDGFEEVVAGVQSVSAIEHSKTITKEVRKCGSKKVLTSSEKYNSLLDVGKEIAKQVSAEDRMTYEKVMAVMRFVLTNYQKENVMALKEASANYMGLDFDGTAEGGESVPAKLLSNVPHSPPYKRSAGATSTKRKKFCVEFDSVGPASKKLCKGCGLCSQQGHDKSNCPVSDSIGRRITSGLWPGFAAGANFNDTSQIDASKVKVDPVVPKDVFALQIVEMAKLTSDEDKKVYKAHPVMKAMVLDDDS
jgi:hypothetical protein